MVFCACTSSSRPRRSWRSRRMRATRIRRVGAQTQSRRPMALFRCTLTLSLPFGLAWNLTHQSKFVKMHPVRTALFKTGLCFMQFPFFLRYVGKILCERCHPSMWRFNERSKTLTSPLPFKFIPVVVKVNFVTWEVGVCVRAPFKPDLPSPL